MKKLLVLLPSFLLLASCGAAPEDTLPPAKDESFSVKLTKANCGLTNEDSTEAFVTALDVEGKTIKYEFEIGPNCYIHSEYAEFLIKKDGYIKSKSNYYVDRLIIDYMSKKGVNFEVLNANNEAVTSHESTVTTEYPGENDYGAVLEYPIDGNAWTIRNTTDYKPAFYSVRVIFSAQLS